MSLIGFEGFDDNNGGPADEPLGNGQAPNNSGTVGAFWTQNVSSSKVAGQLGGSALRVVSNGTYLCHLTANYTRLIWGARIRNSSGTLATPVVMFYDGNPLGGGSTQCGLNINSSGNLFFWRANSNTGQIGSAGSTTLSLATWYYIEVDVTFHSSAGAFSVRINGSGTEISGSGVNTVLSANNYANLFGWQAAFISIQLDYDDLYLLDPTTGSAPFTSMLGKCRVETLFPTAANVTAWVPNASTNVSRVQETSMDSDSTYNSAGTTGQDTFTHGALSSTPATIFAVAARAIVRKDQAFPVQAQTILGSGSTVQLGTVYDQTTSYQAMRDLYLNDPNTAAAWTTSAVNATTIGYNRL